MISRLSNHRPERIERERVQYDKSRRSIRIWPITGDNADEIMKGTLDFCKNALMLDGDLGIVKAERVRSSPRGRAFMEVLVEFEDSGARDRVFGSGPQLSGYRDEEGRPTCGLRLQIPSHLMTQFRTLEAFSFMHINKHNGEIKKHIKFDDSNECLYVQLKHKKDNEWISFSYDQAKKAQDEMNAKKVKKSLIFQSPERVSAVSEKESRRASKPGDASTSGTTSTRSRTGTFVPAKRKQREDGSRGSWRPNATNEASGMDEDSE